MILNRFPERRITYARENMGSPQKGFYADIETGEVYTVFSADDGPGMFIPFDGSRMSGELGLYHAVSGYDETPEGVPEYEWLDCVGIVNQKRRDGYRSDL